MNWEKHFRQMKRAKPALGRKSVSSSVQFGDDFGTIAGAHTIAEVKDLIKAHQYTIDQTERAYNAKAFELSRSNPQANQLWLNDWRILRARWDSAVAKAQQEIDSWRVMPDNLSEAEAEYIGLIQAIQLSYPELRVSYGDLTDLVGRLSDLGAAPDLSQTPQPDQDSDFDFNVIREIEPLNVVDKALNKVKDNKKTLIIVGVLAAGAGFLLLPKVLRVFIPIRL